jgi:hypothetical protein
LRRESAKNLPGFGGQSYRYLAGGICLKGGAIGESSSRLIFCIMQPKKNPPNPAKDKDVLVDYNALAPDTTSCIGNEEFIECYDFRDSGGGKAVEFHGKGQKQIVWRASIPFIIFFESPEWGKYLKPVPPTLPYLYLAGIKLTGLHSYKLQRGGKLPHVVVVSVKPEKDKAIYYRFIPDLPKPKRPRRPKRQKRTKRSSGSVSRATIILQD